MTSPIDLLVVFHNSSRFIQPLFESLQRLSALPVTGYFLDNASTDDTCNKVESCLPSLPFRAHFFLSARNIGFGGGMNRLAQLGTGEFLFLLNPDTELDEGCLEKLLSRAQSDPEVGICEARQTPREHPKTYDAQTGETSWCAAAAVLIRREAFLAVGGFDEPFFMYCEDVDLSWKLWLRGWKCVYVPDAVVRHYTQDIIPGKRRTWENYFSFRNSIFLYYRFGSWAERRVLYGFLWKRFIRGPYSWRSRLLYAFAFAHHIRYIPYLFRTRYAWYNRHPWVRLNETSLAE